MGAGRGKPRGGGGGGKGGGVGKRTAGGDREGRLCVCSVRRDIGEHGIVGQHLMSETPRRSYCWMEKRRTVRRFCLPRGEGEVGAGAGAC